MPTFRLILEDEKYKWNKFLSCNDFLVGNLLQSWQWGEFQKAMKKKVFRIAVEDENKRWRACAQVVELGLPFNQKIFYIPRGPIFSQIDLKNRRNYFQILMNGLHGIAHKEKALFLRVDPPWLLNEQGKNILQSLGLQKALKDVQPANTITVDLTKDLQSIISDFKQKTRYNIRVAQRHEVSVVLAENSDDFEDFFQLLKKTAKRDRFFLHEDKYYRTMFKTLNSSGFMKLFMAKRDDAVVAGALIGLCGKIVTYLHGASDYEARRFMGPYLLHWHVIQTAKRQGYKTYDLNGIQPAQETTLKKPDWAGLTRFKRGFSPKTNPISLVGTWELPYHKGWYKLYRLRGRLLY